MSLLSENVEGENLNSWHFKAPYYLNSPYKRSLRCLGDVKLHQRTPNYLKTVTLMIGTQAKESSVLMKILIQGFLNLSVRLLIYLSIHRPIYLPVGFILVHEVVYECRNKCYIYSPFYLVTQLLRYNGLYFFLVVYLFACQHSVSINSHISLSISLFLFRYL